MELTVPTIWEQTGWERPHPQGLCQKWEVMTAIFLHDFDLHNGDFQAYCLLRGVQFNIKQLAEYEADFTYQMFLDTEGRWYAVEDEDTGTHYRYTQEEVDDQWDILDYSKGRLQDAWEVFIGGERVAPPFND